MEKKKKGVLQKNPHKQTLGVTKDTDPNIAIKINTRQY